LKYRLSQSGGTASRDPVVALPVMVQPRHCRGTADSGTDYGGTVDEGIAIRGAGGAQVLLWHREW